MKKPELLKDTSQKELYGTNWRTNEQESEVVDSMEFLEKNYPEMTGEFKRIQQEQYKLFCKKQYNYGTAGIAMGTNLANDDDIRLSTTGLVIRINDKSNRLVNLVIRQNRDDNLESVSDSFSDISNYSVMAMIVRNGKWGK